MSLLINPLLLPAVLLAALAAGAGADTRETGLILALGMLFLFVLPLAYLATLVLSGQVKSLDVHDRMDRRMPLIVGVMLMVILLSSLAVVTDVATAPVISVAAIMVLNTLVLLLITVDFKISLHATGIASFLSIIVFFDFIVPGYGMVPGGWTLLVISALAIPLVDWARVRLNAHSRREVLAGTLFGLFVPVAELLIIRFVGLL